MQKLLKIRELILILEKLYQIQSHIFRLTRDVILTYWSRSIITYTSKLNAIQGKRIVDAILNVGDAGIKFEGGAQLAIYNLFEIKGKQSLVSEDLLGCTVIKVKELKSSIEVFLEGDIVMTIDMKDDAFTGPEAIQLLVPGEQIVVWN